MTKPPMDARDASWRPTAGSVPPTKPRRVIVGDDPKKHDRPAAPDPEPTRHDKGGEPTKRPDMFHEFKLGEYEIGPSIDGLSATVIPIMAIILGLLAFVIFQDNKRHQMPVSPPPICARGYEI